MATDTTQKDGTFKNYYGKFITTGETKTLTPAADPNKYDISKLQYPIDLSTNKEEYGGHKVVFFINVAGATNLQLYPGKTTLLNIPEGQQSNFNGTKVIEAMDNQSFRFLKAKKRLAAAIALYIPNSLSNSFSVNWAEESSEEMMKGELLAGAILAVAGQGANAKAASGSSILKKLAGAGEDLLNVGGAALGTKLLGGNSYAQKAAGIAPGQSKAQQLFKNVNFREFSFDYNFAPKSEEESAQVLNIIRHFKFHMLPEFYDETQYLYVYPSEFEVKYYIGSNENQYLERQYTAVLTSMNINYTPNNQFMTFPNGMPTHIQLSLSFKELAMASKETEPILFPDMKGNGNLDAQGKPKQ